MKPSDRESFLTLIEAEDIDGFRNLLKEVPDLITGRFPEVAPGATGLQAIISLEGDPEFAQALIDAGISLEARNDEGRTALHDAIEFGEEDIARVLVDAGATVDVCTAAIIGDLEVLTNLLEVDAELANDLTTGMSPMCWAAFGNEVEAARLLLRHGARMDDGELLCAALVGHVEMGEFLIGEGVDPNEMCGEVNALHAAVTMRYTPDSSEFVKLLLAKGADVESKNGRGETAREMALIYAEVQEKAKDRGEVEEQRNFKGVAELLK